MITMLKHTYGASPYREAISWLDDPSSYPPLPVRDSREILLQLFFVPSFEPICSWTVYRAGTADYELRRIRWDRIADEQAHSSTPSTFGSDGVIPKAVLDESLSELDAISFPALQAPEMVTIADGEDYGIRRTTFRQLSEIWWSYRPSEWESIERWYRSARELFDSLLPMSTEPGGQEASYRFAAPNAEQAGGHQPPTRPEST